MLWQVLRIKVFWRDIQGERIHTFRQEVLQGERIHKCSQEDLYRKDFTGCSSSTGQFNNIAVSIYQTRRITDGNGFNTNSLRMNDVINRASARLAELGVTESMVNESVGNVHVADNVDKGRKSGAVSKATGACCKKILT